MKLLARLQVKWMSWNLGATHGGIRFQAQWRWWTRRWGFAVSACLIAWSLGVWLHAPTWRAHAQLQSEVQTLQAQLAAVPTVPSVQPKANGADVSDDIKRLPTADQHEQLWTHLQNTLAVHRVKLLVKQPVSNDGVGPLPSQAMFLRLQARFENWAGAWASLARMGPVWSMDRLRVVPSIGNEGVDIEVVWRVWFSPATAGTTQASALFAGGSPDRPQASLQKDGASIFDLPFQKGPKPDPVNRTGALSPMKVAVGVLPKSEGPVEPPPKELVFSNEPERWPMLPLRVIGIWQQGEQAEAVVANATHWFRTQEGRPISQEGHRVWRIGRDGIQVRDPAGRIQTFQMETRMP